MVGDSFKPKFSALSNLQGMTFPVLFAKDGLGPKIWV